VSSATGVIADTRQVKRLAWEKVAQDEKLHLRKDDQLIHDKIYDLRLERAITEVLQWTRDWSRAKALAWKVALACSQEFTTLSDCQPGVREWLQVLSKAQVPCAVVSAFDRLVILLFI
jgi:beta-phosphoglucomutase-like phosphatase (HAD superfamily)